MISLYQLGGVHLVSGFPGIVTFWIAFPFEEVLELFSPPMMSVASYLLHLILRFS